VREEELACKLTACINNCIKLVPCDFPTVLPTLVRTDQTSVKALSYDYQVASPFREISEKYSQ
jgi:hypothetical protein